MLARIINVHRKAWQANTVADVYPCNVQPAVMHDINNWHSILIFFFLLKFNLFVRQMTNDLQAVVKLKLEIKSVETLESLLEQMRCE